LVETVGVMLKDLPAARGRMTLDRFVELTHVQARIVPQRGREVDDALARVGRARRVAVVVPQFPAVFPVVAASDCITAVSRRLALSYAKQLPLRIFALPIEIPTLTVGVYWHQRADADPGVRALRGMVRDVLR
jgi:DNA-binding transcriptional LysR family regulator